MTKITTSRLIQLVNTCVSETSLRRASSEADYLPDLGIDSLATVNILLTAATEFDLDLSRLDSSIAIPTQIGDLLRLVQALQT